MMRYVSIAVLLALPVAAASPEATLTFTRFAKTNTIWVNLSPEGLAAYKCRGDFYLAIANEVRASGATTTNTTLYRVDRTGR